MIRSKTKEQYKERKMIVSYNIEPSKIAYYNSVMNEHGQKNFSQFTREALKFYVKYLEESKKK